MTTILLDSSLLGQHLVNRLLSAEIMSRLSALHAELAEMARGLDALESGLGIGEDAFDDRLDTSRCNGAKLLWVADDDGRKLAGMGLRGDIVFD